MGRTTVTVEFEREEFSCLIDYLFDDLRAWSEKGFESEEEEKQFQRIVSMVSKLHEANRENEAIFIRFEIFRENK